MAVSAHAYAMAIQAQYGGAPINWSADPIYIALTTSGYSPSRDTDQYWIVAQPSEVSGPGYSANGIKLTGTTVGAVTASHEIPLLANSVSWTNASFSANYAVIYKKGSNAGSSPLLGFIDFGGTETVTNGTFLINFDITNGIFAISGP